MSQDKDNDHREEEQEKDLQCIAASSVVSLFACFSQTPLCYLDT